MIRIFLGSLAAIVVLLAASFFLFVYPATSEAPPLSGTLSKASLAVGGLKRTYLTYIPKGLPKGAPLVIVMHGSDQDGADARAWTGYGFDRLADAQGFAVAYPDGYGGNWNACNSVGDYSANKLDIDDVGFLTGLADKLIGELGIDPTRVFAAGVSRGGQMAYRLALEAPSRFRAVAAVSANLPAPENFKCHPAAHGKASVMIMVGTADPLDPFQGGEVTFYGMYKRGTVLSAEKSGEYFAAFAGLPATPAITEQYVGGGTEVEEFLWGKGSATEMELVAIQGGGHGMPQLDWRNPRILGPTAKVDGPAMIWEFFARQQTE
jgi:polyhydroxybutyrate depolymerase